MREHHNPIAIFWSVEDLLGNEGHDDLKFELFQNKVNIRAK